MGQKVRFMCNMKTLPNIRAAMFLIGFATITALADCVGDGYVIGCGNKSFPDDVYICHGTELIDCETDWSAGYVPGCVFAWIGKTDCNNNCQSSLCTFTITVHCTCDGVAIPPYPSSETVTTGCAAGSACPG